MEGLHIAFIVAAVLLIAVAIYLMMSGSSYDSSQAPQTGGGYPLPDASPQVGSLSQIKPADSSTQARKDFAMKLSAMQPEVRTLDDGLPDLSGVWHLDLGFNGDPLILFPTGARGKYRFYFYYHDHFLNGYTDPQPGYAGDAANTLQLSSPKEITYLGSMATGSLLSDGRYIFPTGWTGSKPSGSQPDYLVRGSGSSF